MKILFISMHSIHVTRWIENLKDTAFELYWYDVTNNGKLDTIDTVTQFYGLKKRKKKYIKGEYFLSKKAPKLYSFFRPFLEITENEALEEIIREIRPDVIHSFEMQSCSYPITATMYKFSKIKWLYSCWGNDLFYYQDFKVHHMKIKKVLKRIDYLHTDCQRDFKLATKLGFRGKYLGLIPGGTGYKISELEKYKFPVSDRKIILVKGYQHTFGRGLNVIKALESIKNEISEYQVIIFGAHAVVIDYVAEKKLPFAIFERHGLTQYELMQLMGKSLLYIGNNISDGMPNTLLEAIVMGAFPIQSNPGNVTAEVINDKVNGLLISNPEDVGHLSELIFESITNKQMVLNASGCNEKIANVKLEYLINQKKVIALYERIKHQSLCE